jgi:hypothetical protein
MPITIFRGLSLALLALTITSCAVLPREHDVPLAGLNCQQALPRGYEVRATLQVSPAEQDFLLALGTAPERINLALLTLQGVPVYRLSCSDGEPQTNVQTSVGEKLPPLALLNYLAMIFMDADVLSKQLQPGWTLRTQTSERFLTRPDTAAGIQISYQGKAPWFQMIELTDGLRGVTLSIVILESFRVLPE